MLARRTFIVAVTSPSSWSSSFVRRTVYACSVMPAPGNAGMAGRAPYAVALVDLPEGVRMLGNVVADDPDSVAVGDAVHVAWEPLADGRHLPIWVPA